MVNIYVSSTYVDLKDCRQRVNSVIRKTDNIDIGMEHYIAEDNRPIDKCLKDVVSCDLYIGIFAYRYGHIPSGYDKSITELEYRKACECNKPRLIFLLKDDANWPVNLIETEKLNEIKILRKDLANDRLIGYFSTPDQLESAVTQAIYQWRSKSQGIQDNQDIQDMIENMKKETKKETKKDITEKRSSPNIHIKNYDIPYLKINTNKDDCILFNEFFGVADNIFYFCSTKYDVKIEDLERILKTFYNCFDENIRSDQSFTINQTCNETNKSYSWSGYGNENFVLALKNRGSRYNDARIINPHHSESATFIANLGGFIFYIAILSDVIDQEISITLDVGFILENIPFDNRKFIEFYDKANLDVPYSIYQSKSNIKRINRGEFKELGIDFKEIKLENEGCVIYKEPNTEERYWVSGIIIKNPFYNKEIDDLSQNEKIIVNIKSHHPANIKKEYFLLSVSIFDIPGVFHIAVMNIIGDW